MQHRGLQRMATTDMRVVQALLEAVKVLRPEFGSFDWLVEEVRKKDIVCIVCILFQCVWRDSYVHWEMNIFTATLRDLIP